MSNKTTRSMLVDFSNRSLFEGLFDFLIHPVQTFVHLNPWWFSLGDNLYSWKYYEFAFRHFRAWVLNDISKYGNRFNTYTETKYFLGIPFVINMSLPKNNPTNVALKIILFIPLILTTIVGTLISMLPIRYVLGLALRVALLPVTSLVYCASRLTGIVFNPQATIHNKEKRVAMSIVTVFSAIAGIVLALTIKPAAFASSLGMATGLGVLSATGVGAIVLAVAFVIGFALLLHAAKKTAQMVNAEEYTDLSEVNNPKSAIVTAPKHQVYNPNELVEKIEDIWERKCPDLNSLYSSKVPEQSFKDKDLHIGHTYQSRDNKTCTVIDGWIYTKEERTISEKRAPGETDHHLSTLVAYYSSGRPSKAAIVTSDLCEKNWVKSTLEGIELKRVSPK